MKTTLSFIATLLLLHTAVAAEPLQILNIRSGDAQKVQIELSNQSSPQLFVFLKWPQLKEAQKIISDNYKKQICIQINGIIVSEPFVQIEPPYKGQSVSISFKDVDSAVKAAEEIVSK